MGWLVRVTPPMKLLPVIRRFVRSATSLVTALVLSLASGCSKSDPGSHPSAVSASTNKALHKLTFINDWYPEAEHGGYYAAKLKGYWLELGLDVTMVAGGPNSEIEKKVA